MPRVLRSSRRLRPLPWRRSWTEPQRHQAVHELGEQYTAMGDSDRAVHVYTKITEINPADLVAVKRSKDSAASATMKQGGWETAQSYRDLIRNKDEAISLEQQGRVVKDIHMIERQLGELNSQYEQQPESVDVVRKIAHLCDQKYQITETGEDLETSVTWYRYLTDLTKGADPAIARKFSDLELKRKDHDIKKLEDWFGEGGDLHEKADQYREHLATLKRERAEALISESRRRVERNPTDLQLRFELGERLLEAGNFNDAIPKGSRHGAIPTTPARRESSRPLLRAKGDARYGRKSV